VQFFVRDAALWAQVTPVAERLPPGRAALQDALDAAGLGVWSLDDDVLDRLVARCAEGFEAGELMLAAARPGRFTLEIAPDGLQPGSMWCRPAAVSRWRPRRFCSCSARPG